jgi:PAS domain S-box-containing protein
MVVDERDRRNVWELLLSRFGITILWSAIIILSLTWNIYRGKEEIRNIAKVTARASFNKDQAFRKWGASHGGVYVPVTENTPPNPNLSHIPERDIVTPSGKKLTLMNPAYMVRQVMDNYAGLYGVRGHITSLKLLNPNNAPDEWERKALLAFEDGVEEVFEFTEIDGKPFLRLIRPMVSEKPCLKCHDFQGYKVGDIRGGVGVSLPLEPFVNSEKRMVSGQVVNHAIIWAFGFLFIGFLSSVSEKRQKEKLRAQEELEKANVSLEKRVQERTMELTNANVNLQKEISERVVAESALRESEERFRRALTNAPYPIMMHDEEGQVLAINSVWTEITGYKLSDIPTTQDWTERAYGEKKEMSREVVKKRYSGGKRVHEGLRRVKIKGGEYRTWDFTSSFLGESGNRRLVLQMAIDVTEKELAEERFRKSFEQGLVGMAIASGQKVFTSVNSRFCEIFGYKLNELKKMTWDDISYPDDLGGDAGKFEKVVGGEIEGYTFERRFVRKDGKIIVCSFSAKSIRRPDGGIDYFIVFVQDLTDNKRTENEMATISRISKLFLESDSLAAVYNDLPEIISLGLNFPIVSIELHDKETGEMVFVGTYGIDHEGPSFLRVPVSKTVSGLVLKSGKPMFDFDISQHPEYRFEALKKLNTKTFLCVPLRSQNRIFGALSIGDSTVRNDVMPLVETVQVIGNHLAQEIDRKRKEEAVREAYEAVEIRVGERTSELTTANMELEKEAAVRKQAEVALKKSEENLRSIVKTVGEGIVVVDTNSKILFVNEEFCSIFGYSDTEVIGKSIEQLMPEKYRDAHGGGMKRYLGGGPSRILGKRVEVEGQRKNGGTFPIELRIEESAQSEQNGDSRFFTGAIRDITDRVKADEELRNAKDEAEESTRLKDKFVSLVSHDLKGPLGNMLGFLQIAMTKYEDIPKGEKAKLLEPAIDSGMKMSQMIKKLLDVSRFRTGVIVPKFMFVDLSSLVVNAFSQISGEAHKKGISIEMDIPQGRRIFADEHLISEVLGNLLSNAVKFSNRGGAVKVYLPEEKAGSIAVSDTGVGISADMIGSLFNYEKKTSTIGTAGEEGTGLGLPLSRDIIEAHRGKISVESIVGKGSTFHIELPVVRPVVLLVREDKGDTGLLKRALSELDADVKFASDELEALKKIGESSPDIIIADDDSPGIDSLELLLKVQGDKPAKDIKFVVMSGSGNDEFREKAMRYGAAVYIDKPYTISSLAGKVRRLLS